MQGSTTQEIYQSLRAAIECGDLAEGAPLPTMRDLAGQLGVNRNTVAAAYQRLVQSGLAVAEGRRGTRVAPRRADGWAAAVAGGRDLASGNPDPRLLPDLAPLSVPPPRNYGGPAVWPALGAWAQRHFARDGLPAAEILVTHGAVDAMALALQAQLKPGDAVILEEPCFLSSLRLVRLLGLRPVSVAIDDQGMTAAGLAQALRQRPRALILTPRAHSPTGACLSADRAAALAPLIAAANDLLLIEDDHFSALSQVPPVSLAAASTGGFVVIRSLSKFLGPDLRLACVLADAGTAAALADRQQATSRWASRQLQAQAADTLAAPAAIAAIAAAGRTYALRRRALLDALAARRIDAMGSDGINVWIPLPRDGAVAAALARRDWSVVDGAAFRLVDARGIRVTCADLAPDEADRFAADLAGLLAGDRGHVA